MHTYTSSNQIYNLNSTNCSKVSASKISIQKKYGGKSTFNVQSSNSDSLSRSGL